MDAQPIIGVAGNPNPTFLMLFEPDATEIEVSASFRLRAVAGDMGVVVRWGSKPGGGDGVRRPAPSALAGIGKECYEHRVNSLARL